MKERGGVERRKKKYVGEDERKVEERREKVGRREARGGEGRMRKMREKSRSRREERKEKGAFKPFQSLPQSPFSPPFCFLYSTSLTPYLTLSGLHNSVQFKLDQNKVIECQHSLLIHRVSCL